MSVNLTLANELFTALGSRGIIAQRIATIPKGSVAEENTYRRIFEDANKNLFHKASQGEVNNVLAGDLLVIFFEHEEGESGISLDAAVLEEKIREQGMDAVVEDLVHEAHQIRRSVSSLNCEMAACKDLGFIRERLVMKVENYEHNVKAFKWAAHARFEDFALTPRIVLIPDETHEYQDVRVPAARVDEWGIPMRDLMDEIMENTVRLYPPRLFTSYEQYLTADVSVGAFMDLDVDDMYKGLKTVYLGTTQELKSASVAFYPGVLERVREILGEDFYVVFMSDSMIALHPASMSHVEELREELSRSNAQCGVSYYEPNVLTNEIFYYDGQSMRRVD